jgi:pimeloyl-ACP methyl ester carboxylesterase
LTSYLTFNNQTKAFEAVTYRSRQQVAADKGTPQTAAKTRQEQKMSSNNMTVVLAHGAWADGSSWSKVIGQLSARGIKSVAAPLPLTSLPDDVVALDRTLERVDGPVVLAGHAYAGAVIAATRSEKVRSLVYVTALAPAEGETVADVFYRAEPDPRAPKLAPDSHGLIWLPEDAFAAAFAQNASADEQALLAAVQRPIAVPCISVKVGRPLWLDRLSWFLLAEADRMIVSSTQRFMAERMKAEVRSYPVDHTPSVTAPKAVLDVILEAVRKTIPAN